MFDRKQLGQGKAAATRFNVRYANPAVQLQAVGRDLLRLLQEEASLDTLLEADVVIDATASRSVGVALEKRLASKVGGRPPLISMSLGHTAEHGMLTCAASDAAGVSYDLDRRAKLALARAPGGPPFLDEFWPVSVDRARLFQQEPGCSDPTFRGSATDVISLAAPMLNAASRWLAGPRRHSATLLRARPAQLPARQRDTLDFAWPADLTARDWRRGYEIRIDVTAHECLLGWMRRSERLRGPRVETGGVLFGEVNEFLGVVWISEVSGPPADSQASEVGFVCGVRGVTELNAEKRARSRGSVQFIGMWHTHPGSNPEPSEVDREAMRTLLTDTDFKGRNFLMLIIGGSADAPSIAGGLYARADV
jgi:integrative and conjugative element protein (TIGR02256 family)